MLAGLRSGLLLALLPASAALASDEDGRRVYTLTTAPVGFVNKRIGLELERALAPNVTAYLSGFAGVGNDFVHTLPRRGPGSCSARLCCSEAGG